MALRCLWGFSKAAQRNVCSIHRAAREMQPTKIPMTEEERKILEKLGEPDTETRSYLNELYTEFDVVAEKRQERKERKERANIKDKEPPPKTSAKHFGLSTNFSRLLHTTAMRFDEEKKLKPSQQLSSTELTNEAEIIWDSQELVDYYPEQQKVDNLEGMNLTHGEDGVFDIDELVDILRDEKLQDIAVIEVPPELPYANYIVVCTMVSPRQSKAIVAFLKKMYKRKRADGDHLLKIEGADSYEWKLMDMGNIILHVFDEETREKYDLESLWTVGSEYDEETIGKLREDEAIDSLNLHMDFVRSLKPAHMTEASGR